VIDEPNDLIEAFLSWLSHNKGHTEATTNKYRGYLSRLDAFLMGRGTSLLGASIDLLEEFTGLQAHKDGLAPSSRRPLVASVRGFYAWLRRKKLIAVNPARDLPYPNAGLKLPTPMDLRNAEKLLMQPDLDTFRGVRDLAMLFVLIGCGVRVSGLVNLNESSLIFTRLDGNEWLVLKVREKGKKERLIPAPHECRLMIRAYLGHTEMEGIDRLLPDGDKVLFVSTRNPRVDPARYHGENRRITAWTVNNSVIKKYAEKAGIPMAEAHPHALRHMFGTELTESDVSTLIIQALMGHEDPKTTKLYTRLAIRKLTETISRHNPLRRMKTPITDLVRELERRGA